MSLALAFVFMATLAVCFADKKLLEKALGGDRSAQSTLVRRLRPVIASRVRRVLRRTRSTRIDEGHVEDVMQQVWVTLFKDDGRQLRGFDPNKGKSLEGWIGMVSEREAGNARDKAQALKRGAGKVEASDVLPDRARDGTPSPETAAVARDQLNRLLGHLDELLNPRGRLVLRLLYVDQLTTQEAAAALSVNQQVIWNWQHKIRKYARAFAEAQRLPVAAP
jgi:RNA polymerase sigma-70 factor (ECF subfamily)